VAIGLALVLIAVGVFLFVPADFSPGAKGTLEPRDKHTIWAQAAGDVYDVPIQNGESVAKGQVLLKLRNWKLQDELNGMSAKLSQTITARDQDRRTLLDRNLSSEQRRKLEAEVRQYETSIEDLRIQTASLDRQVHDLTVRSPVDGQVITWDPYNRLMRRYVEPGQNLLTVAQTGGPWEVELHMPDDRIGHVRRALADLQEQAEGKLRQAVGGDFERVRAELRRLSGEDRNQRLREIAGDDSLDDRLPVSFILASDPSKTYYGRVREIDLSSESRAEEGVTVLIRVDFDKIELAQEHLQQGTSVTAKVACGRRSLGFVLFHDLFAWMRKTWFRYL
jgi:multidrug efflux pump subunit AcrA (membrane-fusion protein)